MTFQNYTGMSFNGNKSPMPPFDEVGIISIVVLFVILIVVLIQHA